MDLYHFYHVYADGYWQEPLREHAQALTRSGLADELTSLYVGISGESDEPSQMLRDFGLKPIVVAQAPQTWEQLTLRELWRWSQQRKGYVLYAHTKSAANPTSINIPWRTDMCFHNVIQWRDCVQHLNAGVDVVGAHYIDDRAEHGGLGHRFFGGNYWWANLEHVKKLPDLLDQSRWCAEWWIGERDHTFHDSCPGWPSHEVFHSW